MTIVALESTAISGVDFSEDTGTLTVYFTAGGVYVYHDVSAEEYQGLLTAPSAGKYFNAVIKPAKAYHVHPTRGL